MCNTHGRRINVNRLERHGSGYVGRSEPDFMIVKSPWFRGIDIKMGPEGAMYISDWSDNGECHDHDGIHRTSGRIYRIAYGTPELSKNQRSVLQGRSKLAFLNGDWMEKGDWSGRHARRVRQELLTDGDLSKRSIASQIKCDTAAQLLFTEGFEGNSEAQIAEALQSTHPDVLAQAILLATDSHRGTAHLSAIRKIASRPQSPNVLLSLAGCLQKIEATDRAELAFAMLGCAENARAIADENNLTLMTWYGIEPIVVKEGMLKLPDATSKLQQFAIRRLAYEIDANPPVVESALGFIGAKAASGNPDAEQAAAELLASFQLGLAGRAKVNPPQTWSNIEKQLRSAKNPDLLRAVDALAVLFGDGAAIADLRTLAADGSMDAVAREQAIAALAQARDIDSVPILVNLINDRGVADAAIVALMSFDHPETAKELLSRLNGLRDGNRGLAIDTMASRESYALDLIGAIEDGRVDARELTASQVRQLMALGNDHIKTVLESKWGIVQETPEARLASIAKWKQELTPENLAHADRSNGAALFAKSCATCHKLYGEGKAIAPDLTGANRSNLDYLLMNIVDPSSVVPKQFTTSVIALKDGRVITGVVVTETDQSLVVQTDKEQVTLARADVEAATNSGKSLMPDGLLDSLTPAQVRDLFGFLMPGIGVLNSSIR